MKYKPDDNARERANDDMCMKILRRMPVLRIDWDNDYGQKCPADNRLSEGGNQA